MQRRSHLLQLGRVRALLLLLPAIVVAAWLFRLAFAALPPDQGPGGPILVVTSSSSTYGKYYAEILRTEGFNEFAVTDISTVTPSLLAAYDVVVLAKMPLTSAQAGTFTNWVTAGGNLIAMGPDGQLANLLGLTAQGTSLSDAYLKIDPTTRAGNGIVSDTIQFHGSADRYILSGASAIATLYSNATTPTSNPAVTLRAVGAGQAAGFTYDLATSIVYTRQGNPAWAAQERDGFTPIRPDDKFYGNAAGDPQPDWVDLTKVAIPQADEQQRLLANLILTMNATRKPLPRFWYFPNGKKAVVILTGDDHGNGGTAGRFDGYLAASAPGCSVDNWECIRSTSYIYPTTPLTNAQASTYTSEGFEVALHINTDCLDFTPSSLESTYVQQLGQWLAAYSSVPAPVTMRHHCIVWSDWLTAAKTELNHGMRFDVSYYYWPPGWVNDMPGLFTGSAMPMRLADLDGTLLDVYEATTQMTDESGQTYPFTVDTLLDRATGPLAYYGAYTVNAHTDFASSTVSDAVVASAQAHGVPMVSSIQMLKWLDARNGSSFGSLAWNGSTLTFNIVQGAGATGLQAMLPNAVGQAALSSLTMNGASVAFSVTTIKGLQYAVFPALSGAYAASYVADTTAPTVTATTPAAGATGVSVATTVTATFSEAVDPSTINGSTVQLRDATNALVPASVTYDTSSRTATLTPNAALAATTTYTATIAGGATDPRVKDLAGNALAASMVWQFTSNAGFSCPCTAWSSAPGSGTTLPVTTDSGDSSAVEVGVKFRSDVDGWITGIRFYKAATNSGTHVGNLWTIGGQLLASATFSGETASGWQEVDFASRVPITANTTYIASYFAPAGHYAYDTNYFASAGVDNSPLHFPSSGASGGNGIYTYGTASAFPASTFQASNYWVDVVFVTQSGGVDTVPPTVFAFNPGNAATGVSTTTTVTATFSEAMDASTINANTVQLRNASNVLVPATVSYDTASKTATLVPNAALLASTTYTATIVGGATDPRVKDLAGNAMAASLTWPFTTAAATGACAAPANPIVAENCLAGNAASEWDVSGAGDPTIQGFATDISVNRGSPVTFKVNTTASSYRIDIYRMGYYGGNGARKITTISPSAALPQSQPACRTDATTKLVDCGNWAPSATWTVPATATSGIYFARLVRADTGGASHIVFIVRDDASHSNILFQASDETWQAYNDYGGASLYGANGVQFDQDNRGFKVSYNRPFHTREMENGVSWVFNAEYPMVRWLEANGYDVTYFTGVDAARNGSLILNHRIYMPVGHDEYWSADQRTNVEAARNAGVNLAFMTGNGIFWKTRWENSIDGSNTPYRTLVSYKETHANAVIDPQDPPTWTGTWRDPRFSPPGDGGRPENALMGTMFMVNGPRIPPDSMQVPADDGKMRFWRNTSIATLAAGQTATLPPGTLGFEWDVDADNGFRPPGLIRMSTTIVSMTGDYLLDFGSTYGAGTANHALTLYRHSSGALVFGAGTIQWSWGLDANHDHPNYAAPAADVRMQQATVNLLADMGVQPATLQSGLTVATASADSTAPTSVITSPTAGASVPAGTTFTITGTATDAGGGVVGGVEVSVDGGTTWHPASGRANWTYAWATPASGTATIKSRAVDDSGNIETPAAGITVTIGGGTGSTILLGDSNIETSADSNAAGVAEAFQYTAKASGNATTLHLYLDPGSTATSVVVGLYSNSSSNAPLALLAQATIGTPVAGAWNTATIATTGLASGTKYWIAVLGPSGTGLAKFRDTSGTGISQTSSQSNLSSLPATWASGTTYTTGPMSAYATQDVDATPPTVTSFAPVAGATGVPTTTSVTVSFSEAMNPATITAATFALTPAVSANVSYNATTNVATLTPSAALSPNTQYTVTVKGGTNGVKDVAGNALVTDKAWSFTTAAADTTPPTVTARAPSPGATGVASSTTVNATFSEAMKAATITGQTFFLTVAGTTTPVIGANVTYNATTSTATLTPTAPLASATTYQATVKGGSGGVTDLAGNALAVDSVWTFTTGADTTSPTVTSTSPANGATNVSINGAVTATFSEALNASTVTAATFTLSSGGSSVVATVSYNSGSFVATLTPSAPLVSGTTYTATITGGSSGVKDVAGNPLATNFAWSFTTATNLLVGNAAVQTNVDSNKAGTAEAFIYTASATGTGRTLHVYVDGGNAATKVTVGLYSHNATANTPASLLGQATITSPTSGWNTVALPASVGITSGTKYWIAILSPNGAGTVKFRDALQGSKSQVSSQSTLTGLAATWSAGKSFTNSPMSAYLSP